jgi:hypothetical protein
MYSVVPEAGITLDARFFGQNVVVLTFKMSDDFLKGELVINVITKARRVNNGERNANAVFLKLNVDWLDPDTLFDVRGIWVVRDFVRQNLRLAQSVDEGGTASTRGTDDHDSELDALLDFVSPASPCERHF